MPVLIAVAAAALAAFAAMLINTIIRRPEAIGRSGGLSPDPALAARASSCLSQLIKCKTVSFGLPDERFHAELSRLHDCLTISFPLTHRRLSREKVGQYSLVYRWAAESPSEDPLLFCAHLDIVPSGDGWEHGPFSGDIEDGIVWGRGAVDCKHIVTALFEATELLLHEGFSPSSRDVYFAFGHDEEIGGSGGAAKIAAWFEEKGIKFGMILDEGTPIMRGMFNLRRPVALVSTTEKGFLTLKLTVSGRGGHSSAPPRHSALGQLAEAICRVEYRQRRAVILPVMREFLRRIGPFLPFYDRFLIANLPFLGRRAVRRLSRDAGLSALFRTTVASTMASAGVAPNVLPELAESVLNLRPIHGDASGRIVEYIEELTGDLGASVSILREQPPMAVSPFNCLAFSGVERAVREVYGDVIVTPYMMAAGTDCKHYGALSENIYRFSPFLMTKDDFARMHSRNECIRADSLARAALFYRRLIESEAGPEDSRQ